MRNTANQYIRAVLLGVLASCVPLIAYAQGGLEKTGQASGLVNYGADPLVIAGNIISALLAMTSVFFFILMIYAGFKWMLSRGNDESVTKAKHTISAAIIGMIIIFASYAITQLVFRSTSLNNGSPDLGAGGQTQNASCVASSASKNAYISTGAICDSLSAESCEQPAQINCVFISSSLGGTCVASMATKSAHGNADVFCSQFSEQVDCETVHTVQCLFIEP